MFAGSFAVRTRNTLSTASAPYLVVGYPVVITGNVFDAVNVLLLSYTI